jgi:hypothetical protein
MVWIQPLTCTNLLITGSNRRLTWHLYHWFPIPPRPTEGRIGLLRGSESQWGLLLQKLGILVRSTVWYLGIRVVCVPCTKVETQLKIGPRVGPQVLFPKLLFSYRTTFLRRSILNVVLGILFSSCPCRSKKPKYLLYMDWKQNFI